MLKSPLDRWSLHAKVSRADTHVYWAADSTASHRGGRNTVEPLFASATTDLEVFLDLIRRGVVGTVEQLPTGEPFFHESGWEAIQVQLRERNKGNEDFGHFWYQITVHAVSAGRVAFEWSFLGYKYTWRNVSLDTDVFYELADRLGARVRLVSEWAAIDEVSTELAHLVTHSSALAPRRQQLREMLQRLRTPTAATYESVALDSLRCLEGLLRLSAEDNGWKGKQDTLPNLIQLASNRISMSGQDLELLKFSKHVRDYLGHGHEPELHMAKMSVVMAIQALIRFAALFDPTDSQDP